MKYASFPLFNSHLDLAQHYWRDLIRPNDYVIDATCGNGHDSLCLAEILFANEAKGFLIILDKQPQAIENTQNRLAETFPEEKFKNIFFSQQCHSSFPSFLEPDRVGLIVYNLGYLPKGNKTITTMSETTLTSFENALPLLRHGGAISVTCYPGHEEGAREEVNLLNFAAQLDPKLWSCCHHRWLNRSLSPSLLLIQKSK